MDKGGFNIVTKGLLGIGYFCSDFERVVFAFRRIFYIISIIRFYRFYRYVRIFRRSGRGRGRSRVFWRIRVDFMGLFLSSKFLGLLGRF